MWLEIDGDDERWVASGADLRAALVSLSMDGPRFAVLASPASRMNYIQSYQMDSDAFTVELQRGTLEAHYKLPVNVSRAEMMDLFERYFRGDDVLAAFDWQLVNLPR